MRVRVAGETLSGRALDLAGVDVVPDSRPDATDVATAIRRDDPVEITTSAATTAIAVSVDCPAPGPTHDHVGVIRTGMSLRLRAALASAARSRGHSAPQDDELAAVRERLDELDTSALDLTSARRRVADATDAETEVREQVAALRGRVRALREVGESADEAETELAETTRRLSELETERIAAEQVLARARERARADRDERRERLRLQDRADNLRRAARERLADAVRESFADARESLPEETRESVRAPLAVARVAELDAPVVLAADADPFETPRAAAGWLDAPVVRV